MFDLVQKMVDKRRPQNNDENGETINKGVGGFIEFMLNQTNFSDEQVCFDFII